MGGGYSNPQLEAPQTFRAHVRLKKRRFRRYSRHSRPANCPPMTGLCPETTMHHSPAAHHTCGQALEWRDPRERRGSARYFSEGGGGMSAASAAFDGGRRGRGPRKGREVAGGWITHKGTKNAANHRKGEGIDGSCMRNCTDNCGEAVVKMGFNWLNCGIAAVKLRQQCGLLAKNCSKSAVNL